MHKIKYNKNKKGISELLSYVMLVVLAIAMAGGVYAYLRFYAESPLPEQPCDGISVAILNYECYGESLRITLENTGRFETTAQVKLYNSDGKLVGEGNVPEAVGGIIKKLGVNENKEGTGEISYSEDVVKIEIIPFIFEKDSKGKTYTKFCPESKITQTIENCEYTGQAQNI